MIDEAAMWGLTPPAVVADAGYGDTTGFRLGLAPKPGQETGPLP